MAGDARETALSVLTSCRKAEAWADGALKTASRPLSRRDAALAARLTYGVLQNRALLDFHIGRYCNQGNRDLEPVILDIMRIGAYQILFLDRVPDSAAVNRAVEMTKAHRRPRAAGMVNAILRKLSREKEQLPQPEELSVRYSHPKWLTERYVELLGEEAEAALAADNQPVPTVIQCNSLKTSEEALLASLGGAEVTPHPWLAGCYELTGAGNLEALESFQKGGFLVQDAAAALVPKVAGCLPGQRVIDVCAAPGGKSFAAAMAMEDQGEVLSFDIHPHKIRLIEEGAARLGLASVRAALRDGRDPDPALLGTADVVLCDVPCSGLGIIRKKPDIRYKDPAPLTGLPKVQLAILKGAAGYVKTGGALVYSTCTILPEENRQVVDAFLREDGRFVLEPFALEGPVGKTEGDVTLWPHRHQTDGFYICKLRKHHD